MYTDINELYPQENFKIQNSKLHHSFYFTPPHILSSSKTVGIVNPWMNNFFKSGALWEITSKLAQQNVERCYVKKKFWATERISVQVIQNQPEQERQLGVEKKKYIYIYNLTTFFTTTTNIYLSISLFFYL